jgi:miniconductance mechanosensitive channel
VPYLDQKQAELKTFNETHALDMSMPLNGRRLTNIGTFRAYLLAYLRAHPHIHQEMTLLVRQLSPTPQGVPIEIYAFTNTTAWALYEDIQSDIFDHIFAVIDEFELEIHQSPGSRDIARLVGHLR